MGGIHGEGQGKKLTGAVDYWYGGKGQEEQQLLDDAAFYNIVMEAPPQPSCYEVWPENWDAVGLFLRASTQWRTTMAGVIGLDYGPVFELLRLYAVDDMKAVFEDLQLMEQHAIELINKAAEKAQKQAAKRRAR